MEPDRFPGIGDGCALVVMDAILLANLIAAVPALFAARTHPATVLRSE